MCGALRAHQRITTDTSPPCICAILGALRAHQRITTQLQSITGNWSTRCAPCAPTNYNVLGHNDNHLGARCAPCAPMNYNSHELGFGGRSPGCAPCAPTNYNYEQFMETFYPERVCFVRTHELQPYTGLILNLYIGKVRLVRTHELQHVVYEPYHSTVGCASCAPMNYNSCSHTVPCLKCPPGALRAHQRITTNGSSRTATSTTVRFVRTNELQQSNHRKQQP